MSTWLDYYKLITAQSQANSQLRSARAGGPVTLPFSYFANVKDVQNLVHPGGGFNLAGTSINVGKRALDVLSRGMYMSQNMLKSYYAQGAPGDEFHGFDPLKVLAAGWEGLSGHDKTTSADISKIRGHAIFGLPEKGIGGFAGNFISDVLLDPTTYIGVGAVRHILDAGSRELLKGAAKTAVKAPVDRSVEQLVKTGATEVATKNSKALMDHIAKLQPSVNDVAKAREISQTMPPVGIDTGPVGHIPQPKPTNSLPFAGNDPRLFISGPSGTSERFMLPGPSAKVIGARAEIANIEKAIQEGQIRQFKYGHEAYKIPETGPYKEAVAPQIATKAATKAGSTQADTLRQAILARGSEKVLIGGRYVELGKLRDHLVAAERQIKAGRAVAKNKELADHINRAIENHIAAVTQHAAQEVGKGRQFKTLTDYMNNFGYIPTPALATPTKEAAKGFRFDFEKQVEAAKVYEKMAPAEKFAFFQQFPFLSREDARYLAQASNQKSFVTRLGKIRTAVHPTPVGSAKELVDAIQAGRITDPAQVQTLMNLTGAKDLQDLAKRVGGAQKKLTKAEEKMFGGKIGEAQTRTAKIAGPTQEVPTKGTKDFVFNKSPEAVNAAKRIIENRPFVGANVDQVVNTTMKQFAKIIADPEFGPGDVIAAVANLDQAVLQNAKMFGILSKNDIWMAGQEVRAKLADLGITPEVAANGAAAKAMATAPTKAAKLRVGEKIAEESQKQADEIGLSIPIDSTDLGQRFERNLVTRMFKGISPHLGNANIRPLFLNRNSFGQTYMRRYSSALVDLSHKYPKDTLKAAFNEIKLGTKSEDAVIASAQDDLLQALNVMFSKDPKFDVFTRNGITPEDINSHFSHYGIHEKYKFSNDVPMNEAYKSWDTEDPLDLLSRVQAATIAAMSKRLLADDIAFHFGSKVPKPGHIRLAPSTKGNSVLSKYLDFSLYYPKEIARQFHILDQFMNYSLQANKQADWRKVLNLYDNVLHSYKAGLTIYRPGHHVRNMVGDVWLSYMAGVTDPAYYNKALKIMARYRGRYNDFDALKAIMSRNPVQGTARGVEKGEIMAKVRLRGKSRKVELSGDQVYRAMSDAGLLNDYRTLEDIQIGQEALFSHFRPFGGKLQKVAATTSEARDHYVRVAQFLYELEKGSYKTLREAVDSAARQTRKWHPDGTDLSRFESNVMRRSFLFYSWIRKAIPLVAESMVMRPGRFMTFPKAMYDWAESQGIDLQSMENPFPADQLFPSWITDNVTGPVMKDSQGHYIGTNPGVPLVDVLHDFGGTQAGTQILGSTTPVFKVPWEVFGPKDTGAVATDIRTGVPMYDMTDYLDRQIPGAGYAASITGRSPSSFFTQYKGGTPQNGEQPPGFNAMALLNLLSGASIQDFSKPNYIKQANKERLNRAREANKKAHGG